MSTPIAEQPKLTSTPIVEQPKPMSTPIAEQPKPMSTPIAEQPKPTSTPIAEQPKPTSAPGVERPNPTTAQVAMEIPLTITPATGIRTSTASTTIALEPNAMGLVPKASRNAVRHQPLRMVSKAALLAHGSLR